MPNYEYKVVEWSAYDDTNPKGVIDTEATDRWEYWDSISHHGNRVDLIFRRQANP